MVLNHHLTDSSMSLCNFHCCLWAFECELLLNKNGSQVIEKTKPSAPFLTVPAVPLEMPPTTSAEMYLYPLPLVSDPQLPSNKEGRAIAKANG